VVAHWLRSNYSVFGESYIEPRALIQMIRSNLHQVDLSRELGLEHRAHHNHRLHLYMTGTPSRRFVLILEGQAVVEFEGCGMKFHVGPWEAFGVAIIHAIEANTGVTRFKGSTRSLFECPVQAVQFTPDFTLSVTTNCKYLQITAGAYLAAIRASNIVRDIPRISSTSRKISLANYYERRMRGSKGSLNMNRIPETEALLDGEEEKRFRCRSTIEAPFVRRLAGD